MDDKLTSIAMAIITYAGVAKSLAIDAIRVAREAKTVDEIDKKTKPMFEEARKNFVNAAKSHMEVLQMEAKKEISGPTIILVHAEDQLLTTEAIIALAKEIIELNKLLLKKTNG